MCCAKTFEVRSDLHCGVLDPGLLCLDRFVFQPRYSNKVFGASEPSFARLIEGLVCELQVFCLAFSSVFVCANIDVCRK